MLEMITPALDKLAAALPGRRLSLMAPLPLKESEADALLKRADVACLAMAAPSADLLARYPGRLIPYHFGRRLPLSGPLVLLASRTLLTKWMMQTALRAGHANVYCLANQSFRPVSFLHFALWRLGDRLIEKLNVGGGRSSLLNRAAQWAYARPRLRAVVRQLLGRPPLVAVNGTTGQLVNPVAVAVPLNPLTEEETRARLQDILQRATTPPPTYAPVSGRVLLINAGLGAGGAERQVVNTLLGLKQRGVDVGFVGETVFGAKELSFYLPLLESAGVEVQQVPRSFSLTRGDLASVSPSLAMMDSLLPGFVLEEIANLVLFLRERRPEVLHAWQDSTSIKAAIASLLVGVPCVLMSSRNVNPSHFGYYLPYMRPAYQALASFPHVIMLNNSDAGTEDYCRWLDLPRARYALVRNGMNFHKLTRATEAEQGAFRASLGIPADALLVGSIFRFWPEKRPLLWLACVAELAARIPTLQAVLAGDGPLKADMLAYLRTRPPAVARRIHLLAPQHNIAPLLSSLDLFLLVSRFEGTPNVVLEAQWCGAPVVVTPAGGTAEAVQQGGTGWVVGEETVPAIVAACETVLHSAGYRARVRSDGQRFITTRFGFDRMIEETLALYPPSFSAFSSGAVSADAPQPARSGLAVACLASDVSQTPRLPLVSCDAEGASSRNSR